MTIDNAGPCPCRGRLRSGNRLGMVILCGGKIPGIALIGWNFPGRQQHVIVEMRVYEAIGIFPYHRSVPPLLQNNHVPKSGILPFYGDRFCSLVINRQSQINLSMIVLKNLGFVTAGVYSITKCSQNTILNFQLQTYLFIGFLLLPSIKCRIAVTGWW